MNKGISKASHKISQMWKQQDLGAPALAKSQTGRHKFYLQGNSKDKRLLKRKLDRAQGFRVFGRQVWIRLTDCS